MQPLQLRLRFGHVSAERALSGPGLVNLYEALCELERRGKAVLPAAGILAAIRDKYQQKRIMATAGIPTARFALAGMAGGGTAADRAAALSSAADEVGGFPVVQKARTGGYDGHGVA